MRSNSTATRLAGFALALVCASLATVDAHAHEFWLATTPVAPATGDTVLVGASVGTGFRGDKRPWQRDRAVRFEHSDAAEPIAVDATRAARDSVWARVVARPAGTLVLYESNFVAIELPADEFDAYLKEEGLEAPLAAREKLGKARSPGRERYRRSCKTWIAGADTAQLAAARALPLELVALTNPAAARPLRLVVLAQGTPVEGVLVRAWRQPYDTSGRTADPGRRAEVRPAAESRTDDKGEVTLPLGGAGEWLVSTVRMVPAARVEDADWESTWASLTFHRR